jgi:hypothetical protein
MRTWRLLRPVVHWAGEPARWAAPNGSLQHLAPSRCSSISAHDEGEEAHATHEAARSRDSGAASPSASLTPHSSRNTAGATSTSLPNGARAASTHSHSHTVSSSSSGRPRRARVLDGRAVAAEWEAEAAKEVAELKLGRPPGLGVVLVGSRPDSWLYVKSKQEACQKVRQRCRRSTCQRAAGW